MVGDKVTPLPFSKVALSFSFGAGGLSRPILEPINELQSAPCFVDRRDLDIDQAVRDPDLTDNMLRNIGLDPGRFFRPRNPEHAVRNEPLREHGNNMPERESACGEKMDEIVCVAIELG